MILHFGRSIGRKFHGDMSFRHFPGNTVVSLLPEGSEVSDRVKAMQDEVRRCPISHCIAFLPPYSFHMTAIEGVCDQVRDGDHWTSLLPCTARLSEVDDLFARLWPKVPRLGTVRMRFLGLRVDEGLSVKLGAESEGDELAVRAWRDEAGRILGLHFPGHETYGFHIGLGYGLLPPTEAEREALEDLQQAIGERCANQPFSFIVPPPRLVFFDDMSAFSVERIPR